MRLRIKKNEIDVEVSSNDSSRALGLMHRVILPENAGMLFIFPDSEYRSFWMKNTYIPLSIAYIDKDSRILEIKDMIPHNAVSVSSSMPAVYALEMNMGWFERNNIAAGDKVAGISSLKCESKKMKIIESKKRKNINTRLLREFIRSLLIEK
jgi:uncharacterized protein